ncbi:MAG: 3-hydroxy-3-methylglutaryl-CoA reductase, partial [Patescibacteria group bacterium]|nr:3-hydroxy-3-methylglutaryl-CoA reductase [Patescibacteria group bacterium]
DLKTWSQGPSVFARFSFDTDQAMGMNMVTIALKQVWQELVSTHPNVELISISGNMCVDKKASALNQLLGRGYQVKAEVVISKDVVEELLGVSVEKLTLTHYWKNVVGTNLAGSNSQNMHVANMVAAMFLATGQDIAHVVEGSQANTIMEKRKDGLYVAVEFNNLNIGVVGGGTSLPAFTQARNIILGRSLSSAELAGIIGVACLAGEISGLAALASQSLAKAHQKLGRIKKQS